MTTAQYPCIDSSLSSETRILLDTEEFIISGRRRETIPPEIVDHPLVIAIHGGTYTSKYFDVPNYSLIDRAAVLGIPLLALDRPGYGDSTPLPPAEATILGNAERLDRAIGLIWTKYGAGSRGIVLIGHSIGGAISVAIAARQPKWPLLGIAISGMGLDSPPHIKNDWSKMPDLPMIDVPTQRKDEGMFGPPWTYEDSILQRSHAAHAQAPRAELLDIISTWNDNVRGLAARVTVPIHYRLGEFDKFWIVDPKEVHAFGAAFSIAPSVDARLFLSAGHCIDLHLLGAALQLEQLAFALRCSLQQRQP